MDHSKGTKIRLVVKGCAQQPGIHVSGAFAPVPHSDTIRALITLTLKKVECCINWISSRHF